MYCPKCGQENLDDSVFCNKCGAKISNSIVLSNDERGLQLYNYNNIQEKYNKKPKGTVIMLSILLVIVLFALGIGGSYLYSKKVQAQKYEQYCQNYTNIFSKTTKDILVEEKVTSLMCSLVSERWSSAIESHYKDFNDELLKLNKKWTDNGNIKAREDAKNNIELEMSQLKNPPDSYKDAYNTLVEMYGYYTQIYNQSVSPKGSLITYNQDVNNKTGEFDKIYDKLVVIKPDIKSIDRNNIDTSNINVSQLKATTTENNTVARNTNNNNTDTTNNPNTSGKVTEEEATKLIQNRYGSKFHIYKDTKFGYIPLLQDKYYFFICDDFGDDAIPCIDRQTGKRYKLYSDGQYQLDK